MAEICSVCGLPDELCMCEEIAREQQQIVIQSDKRRYGKIMTVVSGLNSSDIDVDELARILKTRCAAGGTVKDDPRSLEIGTVRSHHGIVLVLVPRNTVAREGVSGPNPIEGHSIGATGVPQVIGGPIEEHVEVTDGLRVPRPGIDPEIEHRLLSLGPGNAVRRLGVADSRLPEQAVPVSPLIPHAVGISFHHDRCGGNAVIVPRPGRRLRAPALSDLYLDLVRPDR